MADDIFISYARSERETTLALAEQLWDQGYTTWIDAKLAPGEIFEEVINAAVDSARAVITIWSRPALASRWVKYESNRGQSQKKLICTHTAEVDPGGLPADFHGVHSAPVTDFAAVQNALLKLGVRPRGVSEEEMPEEAVLERLAAREWRAGLSQSWDIGALEAFIARFARARLYAEVAERRLRVAKARAAAAGDAERERVFRLFQAIEGGTDPKEFDFFLRQRFAQFPELAMPAAERLQELDPEAFLAFARDTPGAGERLADVIDHAERLVRLRDTKPEAAILRLDPGMHTAPIIRIGVSADGKLLATGSHDKTVKLWALPEGKWLRTLRPPIGEGNEGKIYAVALDPAGRWVAAGGWDQPPEAWVRLFDAETGRVRARLGPLPNVVCDLAVSPDGRFLAAGLGSEGVRVWDVSRLSEKSASLPLDGGGGRAATGGGAPSPPHTEAMAGAPPQSRPAFAGRDSSPIEGERGGDLIPLVFEDRDYGGEVYGLAFAPAGAPGRLAATSDDGSVRLYAPDGAGWRLLAKAKAPRDANGGGARPFGIAFAPDGGRLALGYNDALRADLLEAETLAPLREADRAGLAGGNLGNVAFLAAAPGEAPRLAAGGTHGSGESPIFVWPEAGAGPRARWPGPDNAIMDLEPLPGGALAFGAGDPAFGLLAPDGTRALHRGPATADLRDKRFEHFTISPDGRRLRFGLKPFSAAPVLFDLARRLLADSPAPETDLKPADTARLTIDGWENTTEVTLRVKRLFGAVRERLHLEQYERARSLAIAPDGQTFVLGTEWFLRRFDSKGAPIWRRPAPGTVWGVNLARAGKLILAAYADGTIRWHRAEDGAELLALFIHLPDGPERTKPADRAWILFTPQGFYDASSPEAEKLIGWHVNRGADEAADFYPVETFASTFKRPDKIDAALADV